MRRGRAVIFEPLDAVYDATTRVLAHFQIEAERCDDWESWLEALAAAPATEEAEPRVGIANVSRVAPLVWSGQVGALLGERAETGVVLTTVLPVGDDVRGRVDHGGGGRVAVVLRPFAPHTLYQALVSAAPSLSDPVGAMGLWGLDPAGMSSAEIASLDERVDDSGDAVEGLDEVELDVVLPTPDGGEALLTVSSLSWDDAEDDEVDGALETRAVAGLGGEGEGARVGQGDALELVEVEDDDESLAGLRALIGDVEGAGLGWAAVDGWDGADGGDAVAGAAAAAQPADEVEEVTGVRRRPSGPPSGAARGAAPAGGGGALALALTAGEQAWRASGEASVGREAGGEAPRLRVPLSLCGVEHVLAWLATRSHEAQWRSGLVEVLAGGDQALSWGCLLHQGRVWGLYRGEGGAVVDPWRRDGAQADFLPRLGALARQHLGVRVEDIELAVAAQARDRLDARQPLPRLGWYLVAGRAMTVEGLQALLQLQLQVHVEKLRYWTAGVVSYRGFAAWTRAADAAVAVGVGPFGGAVELGEALGLR